MKTNKEIIKYIGNNVSTILEIIFVISVIYCIWELPYCFKILGTIATLLICYLFAYWLKIKK